MLTGAPTLTYTSPRTGTFVPRYVDVIRIVWISGDAVAWILAVPCPHCVRIVDQRDADRQCGYHEHQRTARAAQSILWCSSMADAPFPNPDDTKCVFSLVLMHNDPPAQEAIRPHGRTVCECLRALEVMSGRESWKRETQGIEIA